jgi:aspartate aminotransferase-like enzyme
MHAHYRTVIAGQRTRLSGRVIRFGTMGSIAAEDILADVEHLEATLRDLGYASSSGTGIRAAERTLSSPG